MPRLADHSAIAAVLALWLTFRLAFNALTTSEGLTVLPIFCALGATSRLGRSAFLAAGLAVGFAPTLAAALPAGFAAAFAPAAGLAAFPAVAFAAPARKKKIQK